MVQKIKSRSKVQKVYVSWSSKSSSSISSRDIDQQQRLGDGNTQTTIKFLKKTRQQVILVIRDFAGLTTDPQDLRAFLNQHPSITHIYVGESPFSADVRMLSAAQILKDNEIANLFHCRSPCRQRSL
ncbi:hypothetical protein BC940DRAFT_238482 [Gongronella butleri]|nr:hypothetical protein BC940DRAFT_238482 [Gongronella butleri]